MLKILLPWLLTSFLTCSVTDAQVYYFKKYSTSEGLVQGTVKAIYQDSKGRMWFGTAEGVSIYDGNEFINYGIAEGFSKPVITSFYEISPGLMLVGTLGDGVVIFYDPPYSRAILKAKITEKKYISGLYISQIVRDEKKNIWFVTDDGISTWNMNGNKIASVEKLNSFGNVGNPSLFQIEFYDEENFYAATNIGLLKKNGSDYEFVKYKNQSIDVPVFKLFKDSRNVIWFSTFQNLFYIKNNVLYDAKEIHPSLEKAIYCFEEDVNHSLYLGTIGGIIQINGTDVNLINKDNGLENKDIISLHSDTDNNLWIGSLSGLSKLSGSDFKFVNHGSFKGHFTNIIRDEKNLFVTSSEGLFEIENYTLKKSDLDKGISTNIINHIYKGRNGTYWFSTDAGVFSKNQNSVKHFSEKNGLPHNFIYQITEDKNGVCWIATQRGLAYIRDHKIYSFDRNIEPGFVYSDNLSHQILLTQSIRRLLVDDENSLWVGSWSGGLFRIKNKSVYRFTESDGLLDLSIRGIQIDEEKNIWISTRYGGAFKYNGSGFTNYSTRNGLRSNWVSSVLTDSEKNLWFSTANGLTKYTGGKVVNYGSSDGIISAELLSSVKFENKFWFVSNSQIFSYDNEGNVNLNDHPNVFFKEIKLIDGNLPLSSDSMENEENNINTILSKENQLYPDLVLDYDQNSLVFEFTGIDFRDESRVTYDYILEGFDKNWTSDTRKNYLTYTHLPPGKYSFKVFAINKEGLKSVSPAVFNFEILTPFWQRWWFFALSILFFVLAISLANYLVYQYKIRQALKLEKLRTKISTDLHDEIGTSLSSIAIFAGLIKRDYGSIKKSDLLERIENTSRDLIDKMSDIVWTINPGNDKFEDALLKLKDYTIKILESRSIDVNFNIETANQEFPLPMDVRRNLLMVFKEIVTNAAKYSKASVVKITLRFDDKPEKKILLSIEDNGIGFDLEKHSRGFGINNIKRRAEEINARLEINTSPGKGTGFIIEIPIE